MMYVKHSAQGLAGSSCFHHAAQSPSKALQGLQDKVQVLSIGPQARHHPEAPADIPSPTSSSSVHRPSCRTIRSQLTHLRLLPSCSLPLPCLPAAPPTSFVSLLHILPGASKGLPGGPDSRATPLDPLLSFSHPDLKLRVP